MIYKKTKKLWVKAKITLSTVVFCLRTMFAAPISPLVENLTPSFVTEITTAKSQILHE